ncbi:hypothetical protein BN1723_010383 [Verticillium longisporum]|uniref:chitinase n=1 Tax=Verticillium longisporum TaxID=100787 RepID=A0A0G4L1X8_VERLO|nr:hypothetical protein BN1723_010383 [Verticillium longisporum]CRK16002.1 hypothetical protein BN1708_011633 [Verticillium longisporum]
MKASSTLTVLCAMAGLTSCYQNAVYFPNCAIYGRDYHPQNLPASRLSHVLYAFLDVRPSGEVHSIDTYADLEKHYPGDSWIESGKSAYGCVNQLFLLKKSNRYLKTMLSIGGWTLSANFPVVASTHAGRLAFAQSSVALMKDWGFDGIDVDWEYPADEEEAENFTLLLAAVRQELDAYASQYAPGHHFLLTIASPAGPTHYEKLDLKTISGIIDTFYLMGYDYSGSWNSYAAHQANLYPNSINKTTTPFSTEDAVTAYLKEGVPAS